MKHYLHFLVSMRSVTLKSVLLLFLMIASGLYHANSQCLNTSAFGTVTASTIPGQTVTITTCVFAGEYSTINGILAGVSYISNSTGGAGNYLTIRQGTSGGPVIAHGAAPLTWTATVAGTYYQHVNTSAACGTESVCRTATITRTACLNTTPYLTATAPGPGATVSISSCTYAGEYNTINSVAATTNYISTATGGTGNYLTIRQGTFDGPVVGTGYSPLLWTSTVAGLYFMHLNTDENCGTDVTCHATSISQPASICDYNVPFSGNNSITASGGFICDHAGWGVSYDNNANGYTVINPAVAGNNVRLTFTHIDMECCCDFIRVYDGAGLGGTILGSYNCNSLPPVLTSTTGPLTIQFTSDVSVVGQGFRAEISNVQPPCNFEITISGAGMLDETNFTFTNALSTVVLSGGPFASGSTNIFTHAGVNPPYTFYLSTIGSWNDNIANYEIKLNGTVIHSGTVPGGQSTTVSNITCASGPTCSSPSALNASNITHDEAQLSWTETGTATLWDIEFGTAGFIPTGIPTYSGVANPYTVTGLSPNTSYQFYVRADCGASIYSPWAGPFTFTTLQYCPAPNNVTATPTTICAGQSSNLNATAPGNTIYWYEVPTGGTEIGTSDSGVDFPVSPLLTTTYYAESQSPTNIPGSLTTTTAGGNGCAGGIMFDITSNAGEIIITGFDVIPYITGSQNVNLYVKSGTYVGSETNSSAWTLVGTYNINGTFNVISNISTAPINIPAGSTSGIYLNFYSQYTTIPSITTYSNSHITVTSGMGHCSLFDGCCTPRAFNGTIYYETPSATHYVGPVDPTFGSHNSQNFAVQSNIFDVLEPSGVTISEVDIFFTAPIGSNFTIVLRDNISTLLETYSGQVTVNGGPAQTAPINFFVPAGNSYQLAYTVNPGSMRNDAGATYPYTVPGVISITGNTFDPTYYYWFYNWKVQVGSTCISPTRTPVTVTVNDVPAQPSAITGNPSPCESSSQTYSVTNVPGTSYMWTFPAGWSQTGGGTTNSVSSSAGTAGGTITVTPENSCGTGTPSTLSVVVNPLPVVSIVGLGTFYCNYYPAVTMTGNPSGGTFTGQGVTGNTFDPAAAGVGVWPITYTYTDANTCTNTETINVTVDLCASTGDDDLSGLISVYPNPFKEMLTVEIQAVQTGDFIWKLYDMNGKLIQSGVSSLNLGLNTLEIQTEDLAAGLYMLKSNMNGQMHSIRIVKH